MNARKIVLNKETVTSDEMGRTCAPITRVAAMAVVKNPFARIDQDDLSRLFEIGAQLGETLTPQIVALLEGPPTCYGKAALVGSAGAMEHGGAMLHPKLGKPVRAAVGGGASLMPSNVKVAGMATAIDLPLGHKDNAWSFDHIDTMTLWLPDAPRADEIVLCIAVSDGARPNPRVGKGPATTG